MYRAPDSNLDSARGTALVPTATSNASRSSTGGEDGYAGTLSDASTHESVRLGAERSPVNPAAPITPGCGPGMRPGPCGSRRLKGDSPEPASVSGPEAGVGKPGWSFVSLR